MMAAKTTHPHHSKSIIASSMCMDSACEKIFLENTVGIQIILDSSDEYGLDFYVSFVKPSGTIYLFFHKKKTCFSTVSVYDKTYVSLLQTKHDGIVVNPFTEIMLSECPRFVKDFITTEFNKKWNNLMNISRKLMSLKKPKYKIDIECAGGVHSFMYH